MKMAILNAVFQMTQRGSVLILIILLLRFLLRNYSKRISYFAWLLVGISLLIPWRISLPLMPAAASMTHTSPTVQNVRQVQRISW